MQGFIGATGRGQGEECPLDNLHGEISADLPGKERQGNKAKRESGEEKKKNQKREGGKLKMEGGKL